VILGRSLLLPGLRGDEREFEGLRALLPKATPIALPAKAHDRFDSIIEAILKDQRSEISEADTLLGASFGGLVARALVAGGHTRARLVLIGTLPHPTPPPAARRCGITGRLVPFLPELLYGRLYARRAASEWRQDTDDAWPAELPSPAVIGARLRAIARWGLPPMPPDTVVAWGTEDRFVTWSAAQVRAWGGIPIPLPAGHRPHLRDPQGLIDALSQVE
jgi:hypothetical protein